MDDKQTFHYRPLVVVRMCKSLRKIFSISSRAVWGFGPGRFTQSEPCCHFANICADCALHHHFVRPWVSSRAGRDSSHLMHCEEWDFLVLIENTLFLLSCPFSGFCLSREVLMESWVALGEISPAPSPCLMSQSCMHPALQTSCQNYFEQHNFWATCVIWKWSSVGITQPHLPKRWAALLRKQCLFCIFLKIKEMIALSTPQSQKGTSTLSHSVLFPNLIHKTAALYESPLALILSRIHSSAVQPRTMPAFLLSCLSSISIQVKCSQCQSHGLTKDREWWCLEENSHTLCLCFQQHRGWRSAGHRVLAPCAPGSLFSHWIVVLSQLSHKCMKNIALLGVELPKSLIPA